MLFSIGPFLFCIRAGSQKLELLQVPNDGSLSLVCAALLLGCLLFDIVYQLPYSSASFCASSNEDMLHAFSLNCSFSYCSRFFFLSASSNCCKALFARPCSSSACMLARLILRAFGRFVFAALQGKNHFESTVWCARGALHTTCACSARAPP